MLNSYSVVFVIFAFTLAIAAPPVEDLQRGIAVTPIPIVSQNEEFEDNGGYKFSYETGNGIKIEEKSYTKIIPFRRTAENADLKDAPANEEIHVQEGSYSYIAPDGNTISLRYIADENGFQPVGDHLPTSPPVPEAILKILQNPSEVESLNGRAN